MILLLLFALLWTYPGFPTTVETKINCLIINLEYVNCTWHETGIPQENYTFKSRYEKPIGSKERECLKYLQINNVNVGCMVSYSEKDSQRFGPLRAWLYRSNGSLVAEYHHKLINKVKLNPPFNLTVTKTSTEVWLYWNSSQTAKSTCKESQVRYRVDQKGWQTQNIHTEKNFFNLPFPNTQSLYEFEVKVRLSNICGMSEIWSEWSEPLCWGPIKESNDTESRQGLSVTLMLLYTAGTAVTLIALSCLLIHSERLRVILIPVVPNAGKSFLDLIDNYDGNVEKWLSISKELQDGFKPNFTERTCPVREYRLVSQSSSDSDNSLSGLTDVSSDYQPMHSYSSASTLPAPPETPEVNPSNVRVL